MISPEPCQTRRASPLRFIQAAPPLPVPSSDDVGGRPAQGSHEAEAAHGHEASLVFQERLNIALQSTVARAHALERTPGCPVPLDDMGDRFRTRWPNTSRDTRRDQKSTRLNSS